MISEKGGAIGASGTQNFNVNYGVYLIAIASLLGWVIFAAFGGVGLVSLPIDCLYAFKYRPKPIKLAEYPHITLWKKL